MSFEALLKLIQAGDPVSAGVTNRPLQTIDQNVRYLWEVLQAAAVGSTVYARRVTVEPEMLKGHAAFYNATTQRFERGLAQLETDSATGMLVTSASTQVWGVVAIKHNSTLADILLFGYDDIDISAAIDGEVVAGVYYLSAQTPGKLTRQKPPVSVPVLRADGAGKVFVVPQFVDLLDKHKHYRFELACQPAGDTIPPAPGDRHVVTDADSNRPGWLPADHGSFNGKAPAGAAFGYNLNAHPSLKAVWPPLPTNQASLEWDKGEDASLGLRGVPLGSDGLVVIDRNGIWWMSDCYGDAPWPVGFNSAVSASGFSDSPDIECPRLLRMRLLLWFTKVDFVTDASMVTSLRSKTARIKVYCAGTTTPAVSGDLELDLDLNLVVKDDERGYLAFKRLDGSNIMRGPVVEGIYALTSNVVLTGPASSLSDPEDEESPLMYHGPVGVSVLPQTTQELEVQLYRLLGATEEFFQNTPYLAFASGDEQAYRGKIYVPSTLGLTTPKLKFRFRILGRVIGTLPSLTLTARRLLRPSGETALPLDAAEFAVTIDTAQAISLANNYIEVESDVLDIAAGDLVFFTLTRSASDGYAGEVGVLDQIGVVTGG